MLASNIADAAAQEPSRSSAPPSTATRNSGGAGMPKIMCAVWRQRSRACAKCDSTSCRHMCRRKDSYTSQHSERTPRAAWTTASLVEHPHARHVAPEVVSACRAGTRDSNLQPTHVAAAVETAAPHTERTPRAARPHPICPSNVAMRATRRQGTPVAPSVTAISCRCVLPPQNQLLPSTVREKDENKKKTHRAVQPAAKSEGKHRDCRSERRRAATRRPQPEAERAGRGARLDAATQSREVSCGLSSS